MRNPIRSETDAFYLTLASTLLICIAVGLGAITEPVVGIAVLVSAFVGALVWELCTKDPDRRRSLREAVAAARREEPAGGPRLLVIANRTLNDDELRAELRRRAEAATEMELHIVVPIVTSRVRYFASDVDKELAQAGERLAAALSWARSEGIAATGRIGDPNAALGAIEDELRRYGADEVIISTFAFGKSNWLETGIVERLRDELDIPVTHIVVEPAEDPGGDSPSNGSRRRRGLVSSRARRAAPRSGVAESPDGSTLPDHY